MRETEAAGDAGHVDNHTGRPPGFQGLEELIFVESPDVREQVEPELAAEDGGQRQGAITLIAKLGNALADDLFDAVRYSQTSTRLVCAKRAGVIETAYVLGVLKDLANEERIAGGFARQRFRERARAPLSGQSLDQLFDVTQTETLQGQPGGRLVAPKICQQLPKRGPLDTFAA